MATLVTRVTDLATRIATECKALRTLINGNASDLSALNTTAKTNLVAAINEVRGSVVSLGTPAAINDALTTTGNCWSASGTASAIATAKQQAIDAVTNGASSALDTLAELASALGGDANFAATTATALGKRVRVDAAQTFTTTEINQACANLGIGTPDTDFVSTFTSGLV